MSQKSVICTLAKNLKKVVAQEHKQYMTVGKITQAFSALERAGLIDDLLISEYTRLNEVVDIVMRFVKPPAVVEDDEQEVITDDNGEILSDLQVLASDMKIMLWACGKINDKKRIKYAFEKAYGALQ